MTNILFQPQKSPFALHCLVIPSVTSVRKKVSTMSPILTDPLAPANVTSEVISSTDDNAFTGGPNAVPISIQGYLLPPTSNLATTDRSSLGTFKHLPLSSSHLGIPRLNSSLSRVVPLGLLCIGGFYLQISVISKISPNSA